MATDTMDDRILVTGGAGYVGSHTVIALLQAGHNVAILDNLSNSSARAIDAIKRITNRDLSFYQGDIRERAALDAVFASGHIRAVIHFAGLKAVGESVAEPLKYFDNNVHGTLRLIDAMKDHGCDRMVFSSSATVYGDADQVPIGERAATQPTNPYGRTKLMVEEMLRDLCTSDATFRASILRYFNPVGAHQSGELGEDPCGPPNNLLPYIAQVAVGRMPELRVFGDDYDTPDGTGVRDYIHVLDLAQGHLAALEFLDSHTGAHTHNLGTGRGYSVLEMVRAFERNSGRTIPYRVVDRRPGDIATSYADAERAAKDLKWRAEMDVDAMCADAWRWQSKYPEGFR